MSLANKCSRAVITHELRCCVGTLEVLLGMCGGTQHKHACSFGIVDMQLVLLQCWLVSHATPCLWTALRGARVWPQYWCSMDATARLAYIHYE